MSTIESVLNETRIFPPSSEFARQANIAGIQGYQALCAEAEQDYQGFWAKRANELILWHKPFTQVLDDSAAPFYKWFADGKLNVSYNCLDRHLETQADKVAIIFESDEGEVQRVTYRELHQRVCQLANALRSHNIKKGDRVVIYMPMRIEAVVAQLRRLHRRLPCGALQPALRQPCESSIGGALALAGGRSCDHR